MEFEAKEDINASVDDVFEVLSDVDTIERQALRRGVKVKRVTAHTAPAPGMAWKATFKFRGRSRDCDIELVRVEPNERLKFHSRTAGLDTGVEVEVLALSKTHTRVISRAELTPKTLSARLLVQSMKLARGKLQRRFSQGMTQMKREIEARVAEQK